MRLRIVTLMRRSFMKFHRNLGSQIKSRFSRSPAKNPACIKRGVIMSMIGKLPRHQGYILEAKYRPSLMSWIVFNNQDSRKLWLSQAYWQLDKLTTRFDIETAGRLHDNPMFRTTPTARLQSTIIYFCVHKSTICVSILGVDWTSEYSMRQSPNPMTGRRISHVDGKPTWINITARCQWELGWNLDWQGSWDRLWNQSSTLFL
jgi:hypothetical protein